MAHQVPPRLEGGDERVQLGSRATFHVRELASLIALRPFVGVGRFATINYASVAPLHEAPADVVYRGLEAPVVGRNASSTAESYDFVRVIDLISPFIASGC